MDLLNLEGCQYLVPVPGGCSQASDVVQVLMATRKQDAHQKLRALQVISGFLQKAQEEYLVLLPESLPFLAELLEDPEHGVSSLAQENLRQLEEVSGESLGQYLS